MAIRKWWRSKRKKPYDWKQEDPELAETESSHIRIIPPPPPKYVPRHAKQD